MRMTDDQIAVLNQRLQQLGFETMGDYARALTEGVVGSRQLVEELATAIADKIVVKMTTNAAPASDAAPRYEERAVDGIRTRVTSLEG